MEITFKYAIIILVVFALISYSFAAARKAEAKMNAEHFVVKQMLAFPVMSFVLVGMGVFVYLIILIGNLNKGISLSELSENDSFGVMLGTIFVIIGGFLVFISMRWKMVVSGGVIVFTPFLGKTRTIRLSDVKHIRASSKNEPGFWAFDNAGKKLFTVSGTCRGYMPLANAISPYIDNASEIPQPKGFLSR